MREVAVRRTLIVALCLCGVIAIWVIADQANSRQSADDRPTSHSTTAVVPVSRTAAPTALHTEADQHRPGPVDVKPPPDVRGVHIISTTHSAITVGWDLVHDAGGIAFYQVTLNGIAAGETGGGQLTINWFNDDMSSHFVQVWAFDNAGNRSAAGTPIIVTRPAASGPSWPQDSWPQRQRNPATTAKHKVPADRHKTVPDSRQHPSSPAHVLPSTEPIVPDLSTEPISPVSSVPDPDAGSDASPTQPPPTDQPTSAQPSSPAPTAPAGSTTPTSSPTPTGSPTPSSPAPPPPTGSSTDSASPSPSSTDSPSPTSFVSGNAVHAGDVPVEPSRLESPTESASPSASPIR